MLNSFQSWFVGPTRMEANEAAHFLAKVVLHQSLEQMWMEECHVFSQSIVLVKQDIYYWVIWGKHI
jgi:hypothetical protein